MDGWEHYLRVMRLFEPEEHLQEDRAMRAIRKQRRRDFSGS